MSPIASLSPAAPVTRALLATSDTLLALEGVAAYEIDAGGTPSLVMYAATTVPLVLYEVKLFAEGSWWLPTSTVVPVEWRETDELDAMGSIPTDNVLRPRNLFFWIPSETLEPYISTERVPGAIRGAAPRLPGGSLLPP